MRYLFAHAHPDDETLASGVLIAYLVDAGHEVFVLTGTRGEQGEVVPGPWSHLVGTDALVERREAELAGALAELGVTGSAWLGAPHRVYRDSGMVWIRPGLAGPADQTDARALSVAPLDDVARDIESYAATIGADVLVSYDADGGYGHPDHVRMHEASVIASGRLGIPFRALVDAPGEGVEWFVLDDYLPRAVAALNHHQTQLTVVGDSVVHSGGQQEKILVRLGLQ
ncbi:MAG: PIG-L family deacetylase [Propionibacteriaceae bacterium]|nr:PIG-L family deacetylase [Propionibacteriaceae bacterium]